MAQFLVTREVRGEGLVREAREIIAEMRVRGFVVPKIECTGTWKLQGYELEFSDPQQATLPFGKKFVQFTTGNGKVRPFEATAESVMRIYSVASGEPVKPGQETDLAVNLLDNLKAKK